MNLENVMLSVPPDPLPQFTCERVDGVFGMVAPWRIRLLNSHVYTDGKRAFLVRGVQGFPTEENTHPVLQTRAAETVEMLEGEALEAVLDYWRENLSGRLI